VEITLLGFLAMDHGDVDVDDNLNGIRHPANRERRLDAAYCADDTTNVFFHQSQEESFLEHRDELALLNE
jgi:hypothetical protein